MWLDPEPRSPDPPPGYERNEDFVVPENNPRTKRNKSGERVFRSTKGTKKKLREIFGRHDSRATIVTTHNHTFAVVDFTIIARDKHDRDEVKLYDPLHNATLPAMKMPIFLSAHDSVFQVR